MHDGQQVDKDSQAIEALIIRTDEFRLGCSRSNYRDREVFLRTYILETTRRTVEYNFEKFAFDLYASSAILCTG